MSSPAVTEKGGETRRRLVEAARAAFMERGYAATSMSDLIAAAGLTKGGFYFHFPSKRDVAIEVVRSEQARFQAEVLAAASEHERAVDQIEAMVRTLVTALECKPSGGMAGLERLCNELRAEGVYEVQPHAAWVSGTAELFRRAQAEGDMDGNVDAGLAALIAVGTFCGLEELARANPAASGPLGVTADDYLRFVGRAVGLDPRS